jgi:hypothetical protein
MMSEKQMDEAELEAAEAREAGIGNDDWGQFLCDDCAGCERREVCFNR